MRLKNKEGWIIMGNFLEDLLAYGIYTMFVLFGIGAILGWFTIFMFGLGYVLGYK